MNNSSLSGCDNNDYPPEYDSDNIVVKLPAHKAALAMQPPLQKNSAVSTKKEKPPAPRTYTKNSLLKRTGASGLSRSLERSPASKTSAQKAAAPETLVPQPSLLSSSEQTNATSVLPSDFRARAAVEKPTTPPSMISTTTAGEQAHRTLRSKRSTPAATATARTNKMAHSTKAKTSEKRKPKTFAARTEKADKKNAHTDLTMADTEDEEIMVKPERAANRDSSGAEQVEYLDNGDENDEDTIKVEQPSKAARKGKLPPIPHGRITSRDTKGGGLSKNAATRSLRAGLQHRGRS